VEKGKAKRAGVISNQTYEVPKIYQIIHFIRIETDGILQTVQPSLLWSGREGFQVGEDALFWILEVRTVYPTLRTRDRGESLIHLS